MQGGGWKLVGGDADYSTVGPATGVTLRFGLSDQFTLDLGMNYGWVRPGVSDITDDAGLQFQAAKSLYTRILQPHLSGTYHLRTEGTMRPWVSLGAGWTRWDLRDLTMESSGSGPWPDGVGASVYDENGDLVDGHRGGMTAMMSLGTEIVATERVSFDLGFHYDYLFSQDRDNVGLSHLYPPNGVDVNKGLLGATLGVNFLFGTLDSDGDGIPNSLDADPHAPEDFDGFEDFDGAPDLDNDGDGIPDTEDGAPNDAEDIDGYEDHDGIPDMDNDGDGIPDSKDGAPNMAEDVDGFQDTDGIPDPDNDGDGVLDANDRCADTPKGVEVDESGCPVVEEIREDLVLEGVTFASNSAELTGNSETVLRHVAESLQAWPDVRIEVEGHTDSRGAAEHNRDLSKKRALSVRAFLIAQGIDGSRITAVGYGEEFPIADNSTAAGRAANRRVEVHRIDR
jgi:outer membrane protein OmpA-like peptidoglycan-associated protein